MNNSQKIIFMLIVVLLPLTAYYLDINDWAGALIGLLMIITNLLNYKTISKYSIDRELLEEYA